METIGVAVSTTGHEHRMGFLETCVRAWLDIEVPPIVTVDGDQADVDRVGALVGGMVPVYRVGQPERGSGRRLGVAANKNTGIELLMEKDANHIFLCDDDTWPKNRTALNYHMSLGTKPHSMVNWGRHRAGAVDAEWKWPRGVLLYAHQKVIEQAGGMIEAFGLGGHEHVEWSRRIHQMGLTTTDFPAPPYMKFDNGLGAHRFWHAEDMPRFDRRRIEPLGDLRQRRRNITSVERPGDYWENAEQIMRKMDGAPEFVPFRANENGRESATMYRS